LGNLNREIFKDKSVKESISELPRKTVISQEV
jgi:hypothetical protein